MEENQIQPQPYWADFKIKVGLYVNQNEGGETKRVLIDPKDIQFKFTYKDSRIISWLLVMMVIPESIIRLKIIIL